MWSAGSGVQAELLAAATRSLQHRGPDQESVWISPDGAMGLGHRRLSIIDLEGGGQPICNEDATVHAVVNGEFYDFEPLRRKLEDGGHRFSSKSDSEILVHLYEEHGANAVQYLRGEFAFVLWDQRKRRLLAARDRFGIKPLFTYQNSNSVLFASEVKALFCAGIPREWDCESLYQQLFIFPDQDRTLYRNVKQVPPGCLFEVADGCVRIHKYWDLDYPEEQDCHLIDEQDAIEHVRDLLLDAVRTRTRADVPVSSFLSGGIDSSAVTGFASRQPGALTRCFTVSFDQEDYDEFSIAANSSRAAGVAISLVAVDEQDALSSFTKAIEQAETLGVNWHGVARYLLCRSIHNEQFKVALTGEGGDEMFAGYIQMRQDLANAGTPGATKAAELRDVASILGFVPAWIRKLAESRSIFSLFLVETPQWNPYVRCVQQIYSAAQFHGRHPVHQSLYLWIRSVLLNYILYAERLEMAHAVETRMPLLDHRLFEYVRTLPVNLLIRGTTEKYVFREAARGIVTEEVYARPKHPFFAPPLRRSGARLLQTFVQDTLRSSGFRGIPYFDAAAVIAVLDRLDKIPDSQYPNLNSALLMMTSACVLHQRYGLAG